MGDKKTTWAEKKEDDIKGTQIYGDTINQIGFAVLLLTVILVDA